MIRLRVPKIVFHGDPGFPEEGSRRVALDSNPLLQRGDWGAERPPSFLPRAEEPEPPRATPTGPPPTRRTRLGTRRSPVQIRGPRTGIRSTPWPIVAPGARPLVLDPEPHYVDGVPVDSRLQPIRPLGEVSRVRRWRRECRSSTRGSRHDCRGSLPLVVSFAGSLTPYYPLGEGG